MPEDYKVLIVEDDLIIANDIASLLRHNGYEVIGIATNKRKALFYINQFSIDIAILDISMEEESDGITISKIIRDKHHFPFIFLTSFSDDKILTEAQEQEPEAYLVKPFQDATLLASLKLSIRNFKNRSQHQPDFSLLEDVLTTTEMKICKQLTTGLTYEEIAQLFNVSKNTIRFHAKNIFFKLDISKRSGIIEILNAKSK